MRKLGYGPDNRLPLKFSTRNVPKLPRLPSVVAISQLREVYVDGELELIETANWFPRVTRKDYTLGVDVSDGGLDEPDQKFYENYVCGADRNLTRVLRPRDRPADRPAIDGGRPRKSAASWSGRSNADWRRMHPGRCCSIRGLPPACSRGSRV